MNGVSGLKTKSPARPALLRWLSVSTFNVAASWEQARDGVVFQMTCSNGLVWQVRITRQFFLSPCFFHVHQLRRACFIAYFLAVDSESGVRRGDCLEGVLKIIFLRDLRRACACYIRSEVGSCVKSRCLMFQQRIVQILVGRIYFLLRSLLHLS